MAKSKDRLTLIEERIGNLADRVEVQNHRISVLENTPIKRLVRFVKKKLHIK
jgi:hypothetical protein